MYSVDRQTLEEMRRRGHCGDPKCVLCNDLLKDRLKRELKNLEKAKKLESKKVKAPELRYLED